jgi:hypothetical protein
MKKWYVAALATAGIGMSATAVAQEHWTEGPVWNCSYYYVSGENWDKYMLYLRRNTLPLQNAQKKAGLIADYRTFTKEPRSTDDWNFAACSLFKSYGQAYDFDAADEAKMKSIATEHWKTQDEEAQRKAAAERLSLRKFLGSTAMRQIDFRPLP